MSIPFSNTHYRVPRGFGNLLEGLTREILREQPDDLPAFAAVYFTTLLEQREKTDFDPAEWGAKSEDRFYNSHAFMESSTSESEDEFGESPTPASFEEVIEETRSEEEQPSEEISEWSEQFQEPDIENDLIRIQAAVIIQSYIRGFLARKQVQKMREG
ncbi:sperm surface protein Sp17-like [Lissotriton helveticus]